MSASIAKKLPKKTTLTVSTEAYVGHVNVEVDLTVEDIVAQLSDDDAKVMMAALAARLGTPASPGTSPLLDALYIATSRHDDAEILRLAPRIVREFGGRIV